jgi:predicted nucleic acid-binding protein
VIVVSNTTPLNYLVLLKKDHILPVLFGTVVVPPAVVTELTRKDAPEPVRAWILASPPWFRVETPHLVDASLDLGVGESEAIALAEELHADRILLDDSKARRIAMARGLKVAGTLAVLVEAHERGLLDLRRTIDELRETTFYVDEELLHAILVRILKP